MSRLASLQQKSESGQTLRVYISPKVSGYVSDHSRIVTYPKNVVSSETWRIYGMSCQTVLWTNLCHFASTSGVQSKSGSPYEKWWLFVQPPGLSNFPSTPILHQYETPETLQDLQRFMMIFHQNSADLGPELGGMIYDDWLVVTGTFFIFPYIGNNHLNWRTHIFQGCWNHQPDDLVSWDETVKPAAGTAGWGQRTSSGGGQEFEWAEHCQGASDIWAPDVGVPRILCSYGRKYQL